MITTSNSPMRILSLLVVSLTATAYVMAGTVNILPMQPTKGQSVTIEYRSDASSPTGALHAVIYAFGAEAEAPQATEIALKEDGSGRWTGAWKVTDATIYAHVKVGNGSAYDTNKDRYWAFIVSGSDGRALPMANFRAAMACYGMLPQTCRKAEDLDEALEYLEQETRLFPKNISAAVNLAMLRRRTEQIEDAEMRTEMNRLTSLMPQAATPMDAIGLSEAYTAVGDPMRARQILVDAATRFPGSKAEEQLGLSGLGEAQTIEEFFGKLADHLDKFPQTFARQNIIDAAFNTAAQQREVGKLVPFLQRVKPLSASAHHMAANYFGAIDSLRALGLKHADDGLKSVDDDKLRPSFAGTSEWREGQRIMRSQLYYVRGAIQKSTGASADAITSLRASIDAGGTDAPAEAGTMLVDLLASGGKRGEAVAAAERAIRSGAATPTVVSMYRQLQQENGADAAAIDASLSTLQADGRKVLSKRLAKDLMQANAIDGQFTTLDGAPLKISDWKGKVVFVDYWATWCGPCIKSFPALQKLYERYKDNPNVVIAAVNVWERSKDRATTVRDFLGKNKYITFPIYMDPTDSVVSKYGVTGIPSKFILGKDGRIQFKEVGMMPEEQFLEETSNKIELLLGM